MTPTVWDPVARHWSFATEPRPATAAIDDQPPHPASSFHVVGAQTVDAEVDRELRTLRIRDRARRLFAAEQRPLVARPEVLSLAERLQRPPTPVRYRIDGWQPAGSRVVCVAQFKAGKTTLVSNLARCLCDGAHWLGVAKVEPVEGMVALFDDEMGERQLDEWLADQLFVHPEKLLVIPLRGRLGAFNLLDEEARAGWASLLREYCVEYVIIDCLRPLLDALGLDENHDAGRLLVAIDALLLEGGVADACLVHHMGHGQERARGDSRIRDWPDAEWRLVRATDAPNSPRYITAFGRDVDVPESALSFDPFSRRLTLERRSRRDDADAEALEVVLEVLRAADEPLSQRAIERELSESAIGRNAVRNALAYGIKNRALVQSPGPRRSHLYQCASAPSAP